MVDELDEARERAKAAWLLIQADVIRLKEAVRSEVDQVKQLGPRSIWNSYPLPILGGLAGLGLLFGMRGGRRKAAYRAIVRAGTDVLSTASRQIAVARTKPEKSIKRKLIETLILAIGTKGAQVLAEMAQNKVHDRIAGPPRRDDLPALSSDAPRTERHVIVPRGI